MAAINTMRMPNAGSTASLASARGAMAVFGMVPTLKVMLNVCCWLSSGPPTRAVKVPWLRIVDGSVGADILKPVESLRSRTALKPMLYTFAAALTGPPGLGPGCDSGAQNRRSWPAAGDGLMGELEEELQGIPDGDGPLTVRLKLVIVSTAAGGRPRDGC